MANFWGVTYIILLLLWYRPAWEDESRAWASPRLASRPAGIPSRDDERNLRSYLNLSQAKEKMNSWSLQVWTDASHHPWQYY